MAKQAGYVLHADPDWLAFQIANSQGTPVAYVRGAGAPMRNVAVGASCRNVIHSCFTRRRSKKTQVEMATLNAETHKSIWETEELAIKCGPAMHIHGRGAAK
jgi:hypothetical protein